VKPCREPGSTRPAVPGLLDGVDLVEHAAVREVFLLGRLPAAEIVDVHQLDINELILELGGDVGIGGAIEVLAGQFLSFF